LQKRKQAYRQNDDMPVFCANVNIIYVIQHILLNSLQNGKTEQHSRSYAVSYLKAYAVLSDD